MKTTSSDSWRRVACCLCPRFASPALAHDGHHYCHPTRRSAFRLPGLTVSSAPDCSIGRLRLLRSERVLRRSCAGVLRRAGAVYPAPTAAATSAERSPARDRGIVSHAGPPIARAR